MSKKILTVCSVILVSILVSAQERPEIPVTEFLTLSPLPVNKILFSEDDISFCWLKEEPLDMQKLWPEAGDSVAWIPNYTAKWEKSSAFISFPQDFRTPIGLYAAYYLSTDRRQNVTLKVITSFPATLYVDGEKQASISTSGTEEVPNTLLYEADLHTGKHLVVVKSLITNNARSFNLEASVSLEEGISPESAQLSVHGKRSFSQFDFNYELQTVGSAVISPDGKKCAYERTIRDRFKLKSKRTIEIKSTIDSKLLDCIEFAKSVSSPVFSQQGNFLYFNSSEDDGTVIWKKDLTDGEIKKVFGPVKGVVKTVISPDGKTVYYSVDGDRKTIGNDRYTMQSNLEERLTDWTNARVLYAASLVDGTVQKISALGNFAIDEFALSPEGDKLAITKRYAITGRPFFQTEIWLWDINNSENRLLLSKPIPFETRPLNLTFIPGGEYLIYTASGYFTGEDEVGGRILNLSETDIWALNLKTLELQNLTGNKPAPTGEKGYTVDEHIGSCSSLIWNPADKKIYFGAMVRGFNKLYSIDVANPNDVKEVPLKGIYIKNVDISADGKKIIFTNEELDKPADLYVYDIKTNKSSLLCAPNSNILPEFDIGKYERWDFTDSNGELIDGWILYPPNFDPARKYPCIVYYYAGVWHQDESFYYTYHFWNANGYIVYALSPVGCIAHGDDFSAYHTNDWGTAATLDIIEGTQKLITEKTFIDKTKLGCYGGSYGGFSTMDLITKTDMFACAVSMYGISNIASYWGGGVWGYTYGDIALSKSYPWNRKDLFTDNSPLFNADKIKTPLLLLHGIDDVNVPELESEQMFTALKVLGTDVALVKFPGEDHGIAGKAQNYIDHREMMLEWFDKYLKDQPQGWERRWKKAEKEE